MFEECETVALQMQHISVLYLRSATHTLTLSDQDAFVKQFYVLLHIHIHLYRGTEPFSEERSFSLIDKGMDTTNKKN